MCRYSEALVPGCHDALKALEKDRGTDNYSSPERYYKSRVVWAIHAARVGLLHHSRVSDWFIRGPYRLSSIECVLTHNNNVGKSANPTYGTCS